MLWIAPTFFPPSSAAAAARLRFRPAGRFGEAFALLIDLSPASYGLLLSVCVYTQLAAVFRNCVRKCRSERASGSPFIAADGGGSPFVHTAPYGYESAAEPSIQLGVERCGRPPSRVQLVSLHGHACVAAVSCVVGAARRVCVAEERTTPLLQLRLEWVCILRRQRKSTVVRTLLSILENIFFFSPSSRSSRSLPSAAGLCGSLRKAPRSHGCIDSRALSEGVHTARCAFHSRDH